MVDKIIIITNTERLHKTYQENMECDKEC